MLATVTKRDNRVVVHFRKLRISERVNMSKHEHVDVSLEAIMAERDYLKRRTRALAMGKRRMQTKIRELEQKYASEMKALRAQVNGVSENKLDLNKVRGELEENVRNLELKVFQLEEELEKERKANEQIFCKYKQICERHLSLMELIKDRFVVINEAIQRGGFEVEERGVGFRRYVK